MAYVPSQCLINHPDWLCDAPSVF